MFNISIYVLGVLYRQFKVFLKIGISSAFGKKEGEREGASVNRSGKLPRNCRSGKLPRNCHFMFLQRLSGGARWHLHLAKGLGRESGGKNSYNLQCLSPRDLPTRFFFKMMPLVVRRGMQRSRLIGVIYMTWHVSDMLCIYKDEILSALLFFSKY